MATFDRDEVVRLLREGKSQNAVARLTGCGASTASRIARAEGIDPAYAAPKRANDALRDFAQAERLELLNELVGKVREFLPKTFRPTDLKDLALTAAILIDKRRLEDGEATSRAEVTGTDARDRIARRVDELATRRRAESVA